MAFHEEKKIAYFSWENYNTLSWNRGSRFISLFTSFNHTEYLNTSQRWRFNKINFYHSLRGKNETTLPLPIFFFLSSFFLPSLLLSFSFFKCTDIRIEQTAQKNMVCLRRLRLKHQQLYTSQLLQCVGKCPHKQKDK